MKVKISAIPLILLSAFCLLFSSCNHSPSVPAGSTGQNADTHPVVYEFPSIDDFKTFVATASTDANDYSAPISNLSGAAQWISEVRRDYVLPDSIVDFDSSLYGSLSRAGFWQGENETMHFFFDFNDFTFGIDVLHSPTAANDISGNLAERNTSLPVTDYAAWKAEKSFSPGFLTRTDGNRSAIYTIDNGRVESVKVISGSCRVHITLNSHPEGKTAAEAAEEFLTSPATAGFAALFSEDDTVFRAAVDKINAGLAGR